MVLATAGPAVRPSIQSNLQRGEHAVSVAHHIRIREAQTVEAKLAAHLPIAAQVGVAIVSIAIQFNDQALRRAEQVDDAETDYRLTSEFVAEEAAGPQLHPEAPLGFGGTPTHLGRAFQQYLACDATTPNPLL